MRGLSTYLRHSVIVVFLLFLTSTAVPQMVRNNRIGNDPIKERLCAARAGATLGTSEVMPFEIDSKYVARSRSGHPDATFIVVHDQLVECYLLEGTGRFEPCCYSPEASYWHLIKPDQFKPGYYTNEGDRVALAVCLKSASSKTATPKFDHSSHFSPFEASSGTVVGGKNAGRYDIILKGSLFFKSTGPDLAATRFVCLLTPMLEFKAIEFK